MTSIVGIVLAACSASPAGPVERAGSKTVVGPNNSLLAEGAAALEAGRIEAGIQLTLEGLKVASTTQENAAGHSNACAGYVLLKRWTEALAQCNAKSCHPDTAGYNPSTAHCWTIQIPAASINSTALAATIC